LIKGVIVLLKSGLLIAQRGFERSNLLTPLMSAAIGLSEEMKIGVLRGLEYENFRLYIMNSYVNPDVIVVVATDKEDLSDEMKARELVNKIDRVLPRYRFDAVTGELQDSVLRVIDLYLKEKPELPDFKDIVDLAKAIYSSIPSNIILQNEKMRKRFEEIEKSQELKTKFVPRALRVDDPMRTLEQCIEKVHSWDLYEAYTYAYAIKSFESFSDAGSLLAAKLGLIIMNLPPNYPSIVYGELYRLLEVEPRMLSPVVIDFVRAEIKAAIEGKIREFREFIAENIDKLVSEFDKADGILKDVYGILLFSTSRRILHSPLGEKLMNHFQNKSPILYERLRTTYMQLKLFDILYSSKQWYEIQKILSESKVHYIEIKNKYKEISGKSVLSRFISTSKREIKKINIYALSAIRPYMLAVLVASESYGLSIKDRESLLRDTYNLVRDEVFQIIKVTPPLEMRVYTDFYQLLLHLLLYIAIIHADSSESTFWKEALEISREGFKFFHKLYARERLTAMGFIARTSPIAFILGKSSLKINEYPDELLFYTALLCNLDEETIIELNSRSPQGRFADTINSTVVLLSTSRMVNIKTIREKIITEIIRILRVLGTWAAHNNTYSREFVDNFADALNYVIEDSEDSYKCRVFLHDLIDYTNMLVKNPDENKFEAALTYYRVGKLLYKYLNKFGYSDDIIRWAIRFLEISSQIWESEGFNEKAKEINDYLNAIKQFSQE